MSLSGGRSRRRAPRSSPSTPEPTTWALMLFGLLPIMALGRRAQQ
ncbi:PEP-CTERM sorting domain-containing protein [Aquabacterium sp.]